ncbi:hypothetical protein TGAMA5MH_08232 [Trichoderma gamsii]|uniref:Uncharacterized protein n=1 Tax=Trichoderma gamsii TaxID=398673 RepID=A0A2K0T377_9HYPO|nr:hypothetical protein TGAMA5MH_08232 [Trichoderma gamsii]
MTRESFTNSETPRAKELKAAEKNKLFQPVSQSLDSIAPPVQSTDNKYSAACVHRHFALQVFDREWDMFSDRYLTDPLIFNFNMLEAEDLHRSIFQTGWLGLEFKKKNTVKPRWQNRLMPRTGKILTEEDATNLRRWMSWSTTKPERWLEWKKIGDVSWAKWYMYGYYIPFPHWRDYSAGDLEFLYGFVTEQSEFLGAENEYENCDCGDCKRLNRCEHEHKQGPATSAEQEPAVPSEEDDSWMKMDSGEDSAAGGATEKSKQKKKKKKKQKKRAGKK